MVKRANDYRGLRCNWVICNPKYNADDSYSCCVLLGMKDHSQPPPGKITVHGDGLGVPSPDLVEKRAREIALIGERNPDDFTDADWDQARRELLGEIIPAPPEETEENANLEDEWEVVAKDTGHRVPRPGVEEEETVGQHLVTDGVEEAAHDQMLEARKEELEQEAE